MAVGNSFNRRVAGNMLNKATGLKFTDGRIPDDYSYIELGGSFVPSQDGVQVLFPNVDCKVNQRLFIEINPELYRHGPCNYQSIVEAGDDIIAIIHSDSISEMPSWCFRIYVAR